tara:strand:- start:26 stop:328 length:303 start_codon:yes stop_codon:yes gene_type:complete
MPLGDPNQGQQQWALINKLLRKDEERDEENKKLDLGSILSLTKETEAENSRELQRQEDERQRLRMQDLIEENKRNMPEHKDEPVEDQPHFLDIDNAWFGG